MLQRTQSLVSRTFPEQRAGTDRRVLDTRVDIDPTQTWLQSLDKRHGERRQYAAAPALPTGFGALS